MYNNDPKHQPYLDGWTKDGHVAGDYLQAGREPSLPRPTMRSIYNALDQLGLREKYPQGPGTIPPRIVRGPLPEVLPDLIPRKW